jgi:phage repressor protein C with HTH and peptisase S24 domain
MVILRAMNLFDNSQLTPNKENKQRESELDDPNLYPASTQQVARKNKVNDGLGSRVQTRKKATSAPEEIVAISDMEG